MRATKSHKKHKRFSLLFLSLLCLFVASICVANPRPGKRVAFNYDWRIEGKFSENHPSGTGGGALPGGVGWYRKAFTIPLATKGKLVFIEFDGVYRNSEVW